jgi:hypothetical protein
MNATLQLVPPRGVTVSSAGRRWFDASALETVTVPEGDCFFAELHRPDRNSASAWWGHGSSASTATVPFRCAVLNWGGSSQSVVYQMRASRGASPASTDHSAPDIVAALTILSLGSGRNSGEIHHISEASIPDVGMQADEPDIDINYNAFSSLADSARRNLPKRISTAGAALAVVPSVSTRTYMSDFFEELP